MLVYISGAISHWPLDYVEMRFGMAEEQLTSQGHDVYNPWIEGKVVKEAMEMERPPELAFMHFYVDDILMDMDAIYMLSNWHGSYGARMERAIAKHRGIPIMYEYTGGGD